MVIGLNFLADFRHERAWAAQDEQQKGGRKISDCQPESLRNSCAIRALSLTPSLL